MNRPSFDEVFLQMAQLVAKRATCLRRSVGCVLVNERSHVIATGYNGVARGAAHCNEESSHIFPTIKQRDAALAVWVDMGRHVVVPPTSEEHLVVVDGVTHDLTPSPWLYVYPNACPSAGARRGERLDECQAIHAEQNALLQCRDVWEIKTAYVTCSPCMHCLKLLLNTSCSRLVFNHIYDERALSLWERSGRSFLHKNPSITE